MRKRTKKGTALLLTFALIAAALVAAPSPAEAKGRVSLTPETITVAVRNTTSLKLKNNRDEVQWSVVSGKNKVKLKNRTETGVTVKAIKSGAVKIKADVGGKEYTCKVKVIPAKAALTLSKPNVKVGKTAKLRLKGNNNKVQWSVISGSDIVTLKGKTKTGVMVVGKKAGTAIIQARIGKTKYRIPVTIKKSAEGEPAVPQTPSSNNKPEVSNDENSGRGNGQNNPGNTGSGNGYGQLMPLNPGSGGSGSGSGSGTPGTPGGNSGQGSGTNTPDNQSGGTGSELNTPNDQPDYSPDAGPGLYDADTGKLKMSWDELLSEKYLALDENGVLTVALSNSENDKLKGHLILDSMVKAIGDEAFASCNKP